jgi:hypothetical protein
VIWPYSYRAKYSGQRTLDGPRARRRAEQRKARRKVRKMLERSWTPAMRQFNANAEEVALATAIRIHVTRERVLELYQKSSGEPELYSFYVDHRPCSYCEAHSAIVPGFKMFTDFDRRTSRESVVFVGTVLVTESCQGNTHLFRRSLFASPKRMSETEVRAWLELPE